MNTPVKFELAKLLKEKGFDKPTVAYRQKSAVIGNETILPIVYVKQNKGFNWNDYSTEVPYYSMPTIAEVCMWLYEKYGIWISPTCQYNQFFWRFDSYQTQYFNSPTEAYEAAIEYTLNKLI